VRKRAPKIDRGGDPDAPPKRRARRPTLPKMKRGEIPGIRVERRPWGTIGLIVVSLAATLVWSTGEVTIDDIGGIFGPLGNDWWRLAAAPFVHDNAGYQFIALLGVGIFGVSLESRFGLAAPVLIFLVAGAAGAGLSELAAIYPAWGANGAALGLYTAWLVEDRMALRRGDDREADMIGAWVCGAALVLLSLAWEPASIAAAAGGIAVGTLAGLLLASRRA
jgi:membrane associated rhomboid family serine protease